MFVTQVHSLPWNNATYVWLGVFPSEKLFFLKYKKSLIVFYILIFIYLKFVIGPSCYLVGKEKDLVIETGPQSPWDAQILWRLVNSHAVVTAKIIDEKGYKYIFPLKQWGSAWGCLRLRFAFWLL